jgi:drug/metabolite transporter (DMT)-like permease
MRKGYVYILLAALLFSTIEIALKLVTNEFNPIQLTFVRFAMGCLLLLPLSIRQFKQKGISLHANDFAFFSLTGFICIVISMIVYQMAIIYSKASVVAVLFSCNPVFVVPFARVILKEKIYPHTLISTAISMLGILFILNPFHITGSLLGMFFTLLAAITFALYSVVGKLRSARYGGMVLTAYTFLMGSLELLSLILLTHIPGISNFLAGHGLTAFASVPILSGIQLSSLPALFYIGFCVSGLGFAFYLMGIDATSASTASITFFIKPALASILAWLFLGETITPMIILGIILIIFGSVFAFVKNNQVSKAAQKVPQTNLAE